jgi:micrococcal nuclease
MANARLVANGYAFAYTYPPNIRWSELFVQLQREARENDRGLWAADSCNGEP